MLTLRKTIKLTGTGYVLAMFLMMAAQIPFDACQILNTLFFILVGENDRT